VIVPAQRRFAVPPPKDGPWRLPDHLDLPPAPPRTDGAPPWCFPDHTMLPDRDESFVKNAHEPPQSQLLTETILPVLQGIHPDGEFLIGQDLGIYWKLIQPPLRGALAPDWFYVPNVPPIVDGLVRRSYVMWQEELVSPHIAIEYVSGDGSEEHDRTPETGKFWIYEQRIRARHYAIYDVKRAQLEVYRLLFRPFRYELMAANDRGHYPIDGMNVELGIWQGTFQGHAYPWLRWWDSEGRLLPTQEERAEQERRRADQERQRAERLAERLRSLGVNPDEV
jgi:Uma2 family endonuclease